MKPALFALAVFLLAPPASAKTPVKRGVAKSHSKQVFAACLAAKTKANVSHCRQGAVEKAVGRCECFENVNGWSCEVRYEEVCRNRSLGRSAFAWTGTIPARSRRSEMAACDNAKILSRAIGCPSTLLERELARTCSCEPGPDGWSCMVDQTLWCRK